MIRAGYSLLGFGIAAVEEGGWDWGSFWVLFGLIAWIASTATGILFLSPQTKRLGKIAAERGTEDAEFQQRLARVLTVARFDIALLLLVVVDMTAKPFL